MTLACPACGKKRTIADGPGSLGDSREREACDRCGCDLSELHAVLRAAATLARIAKASLEQGDWDRALAHADRSWTLAHSVHSARAACIAAAARGDAAALERWRRRAE